MTTEKASPAIAKLVRHGIYQYVRLPQEYQFEGDEVEIDRYQNGLVVKPLSSKKPKGSKKSAKA